MEIILRFSASVLWISALGLLVVKTTDSASKIYRVQSLAEFSAILLVAAMRHFPWLLLSALTVFVIKVLAIPTIMKKSTPLIHQDYGAKASMGIASLLLLALALTIFGFLLSRIPGLSHPVVTGVILAALFIAFLHISSRYETWSLAWGMLSLDTITSVSALVVGTSLTEGADVSIDGLSLGLAFALAFLMHRIADIKNTTDVRQIEELKG